jgi:exopolysaccharide biosynthesis polyprenyl glycosylphosphotransferase
MIQLQERQSERATISGKAHAPKVTPLPGRRGLITHREGKWVLAIGDVLALVIPIFLVAQLRNPGFPAQLELRELAMLGLAGMLWLVLSASLDLYNVGRASSFVRTHRATLAAILTVICVRSLYDAPVLRGPWWTEGRYAFMAVAGLGAWRMAFAALAHIVPFTKRVLIIGAGVSGGILAEEMHLKHRRGDRDYQLVGFVDDAPEKVNTVHVGAPVLGRSEDVPQLIDDHHVDTIALSVNRVPVLSADVFSSLVAAREKGVRIVSMPALYESLTERIAVEHIGDNWGIIFPVEHYRHPAMHDALARGLDLVSAVIGCAVVALVAPFLLIANKIGSPGPLFYSQMRIGRGGKQFRIYKFRSMVNNAEKHGAVWCVENDPRITKVGNFLRKTRLDELPQFWNVLRGEMSLIGPRPERPEFTRMLSETIPFFRVRHAVKPGLTGWAQVMYRYGASEEDSLIKLQYDLYYIKHRSPALDLRIIAKSVRTILAGAGR